MTVGINIILAVSLNVATGYLGQLPLGHAGFMAVGAYTAKWGLQIAEMIFQTRSSLKLLCPRSRTQAPKPCRRPLENQKKNYRLQNTSF